MSALVAGMILIAILTTTLTTYYLTTGEFARSESAALAGRLAVNAQQEAERFHVVTSAPNTLIRAQAFNEGPIPIEIAYMMVLNRTTGQVLGVNNTAALSPPISVNPGKASDPVSSNVPWDGVSTVEVRLLSKRGTLARGLWPLPLAPELGSFIDLQTIGLLTMDILSFNFTTRNGAGPWAPWTYGFDVPNSKDLLWRLNITNHDSTRDMFLNPHSQFFLVRGDASAILSFYIVHVTLTTPGTDPYTDVDNTPLSTVLAYDANNPVIIPARGWKWVYFSATAPEGSTPNAISVADRQFGNFILLNGNWNAMNGEPYGQNLAFAAVRTLP